MKSKVEDCVNTCNWETCKILKLINYYFLFGFLLYGHRKGYVCILVKMTGRSSQIM